MNKNDFIDYSHLLNSIDTHIKSSNNKHSFQTLTSNLSMP